MTMLGSAIPRLKKKRGPSAQYTLKGLGRGADTYNDSQINAPKLRTFLTVKVADRDVLDGRERTKYFHGDLYRVWVNSNELYF